MSEADIVQLLCGNGGAMEYDLLLELAIGFPDIDSCSKFDSLLRNKDHFFLTERTGVKRILAKTSIRLCRVADCNGCKELHLCKFYIHGECNRNGCQYGHDLNSDHNAEVLSDHQLQKFSRAEIRQLLLQNDTPHTLLPPICAKYNHGDGEYGQCEDKDTCNRLHVCEGFMRHTCDADTCRRSHDLFEPQPTRALCGRGVSTQQVGSMRSVYHHILLLRGNWQGDPRGGGTGAVAGGDATAVAKRRRRRHRRRGSTDVDQGGKGGAAVTGGSRDGSSPAQPEVADICNSPFHTIYPLEVAEICLSFVKGFCKYENRCVRVHCKMPYLWQVRCGDTWSDLENNEDIERDYCNPNCITTFSLHGLPVQFNSMRCGDQEVRRLSTAPSVLKPELILTTVWIWYWRDEQFTWNPYIPPMCCDLEKRYQADSKDVVLFMSGTPPYLQQYQLSFKEMMQRNMCTGTTRRPLAVRRRPKFISAKDVQTAQTRKRRGRASSQPGRAVTGVKTMEFYSSALPQSHSSTPSAPCITVASALQTVTVSTPTSSYVTPPPVMTPPPFVSPPPAQTSGNVITAHTLTPTPFASRQLSSEVNVSSPSTKLHTGSSLSSVTSPSRDLSVDDLLSDRHQVISPSSKSSDPAQVLPAASTVPTTKPSTPVPTSSRSTASSSALASGHPSQTAQIKHGGSTLTTSIDDLRALVDSDLVLTSPNYVTNPFSHPQSAKYSDPAQVLPAASAVPTAKPSTPVPTSSRSTSGSSASASSHPSQTGQTKHTDQSVDDLLLDLDQLISPTHVTNPSSHPLSAYATNPFSHPLSGHVTNPFSHPLSAKSSDPAQVSPAASTVSTIKRQAPVPPPSSKSTSGSSISSSSHTNRRSISGSSVSSSSHLSQTAQTKYRDPSGDDNLLLVDPSTVLKTRSSAQNDPLRCTASKQRAAAAAAISRAQLSSALESSLYASTAGSAAPPVPPASRRVSPPPPHMSTATTSFSASSSSSSPVFCHASPPPPPKDKCILL